jgi:hypothetical protein
MTVTERKAPGNPGVFAPLSVDYRVNVPNGCCLAARVDSARRITISAEDWRNMINVRRCWRTGLAAPAAVIATVLGLSFSAQAQASPYLRPATTPAAITKSLRSLDKERPPAGGGRWTVNDPVAYRQAVKAGTWVYTPSGLSYKTCVYRAPNHAVLHNNKIVAPSGAVRRITPCLHPTLAYPGSAEHGASELAHGTSQPATGKVGINSGPCSFGSGGVWWAASCYGSAPEWATSFDQEYAVPSNPAQDGALIFLWGGMESANGDTLLQDVLTWGANGSIVTNPHIWYVTNWYLWPGNNSVISPSIHVAPVDTIVADLTASKCTSAGACTWLLKSTDANNGRSASLTVGSGATFDLLIGSNMEVPRANGCIETPANGHAAFRHLTITGNTGTITPDFGTSTPDPQCSISITQSATGADILWRP